MQMKKTMERGSDYREREGGDRSREREGEMGLAGTPPRQKRY
jgi:hypothetical protein